MAAPEDTTEAEQPTNVDKLAEFMLLNWDADAFTHGVGAEEAALDVMRDLAHAILSDFLRTDVEATSLFARPGVDTDTLDPFAIVTWGPMVGRLAPVELRAIALAFLEVAETAEIESAMIRWLESDQGGNGNRAGSVEILRSFRRYRVESEAGQ